MRAAAQYIVQIFLEVILYLYIRREVLFYSIFHTSVKFNTNGPSANIIFSNERVEYCINPTDRAIIFTAIRSSLEDSVQLRNRIEIGTHLQTTHTVLVQYVSTDIAKDK